MDILAERKNGAKKLKGLEKQWLYFVVSSTETENWSN